MNYTTLSSIDEKKNFLFNCNEKSLLTIMIMEKNFHILDFIFKNYTKGSDFIPKFDSTNLFHLSKLFRLFNKRKSNIEEGFTNLLNKPRVIQNNLLNLFEDNCLKSCEVKLRNNPTLLYNFLVGIKSYDGLEFFELKYYYKQILSFMFRTLKMNVNLFLFKSSNLNFKQKCVNIFLRDCNGNNSDEKINIKNCTILLFLLESLHENFFYNYNNIFSTTTTINGVNLKVNDSLNKPGFVVYSQIIFSLNVCFKKLEKQINCDTKLEKPTFKILNLVNQIIKLKCIKNVNYLILDIFNYWFFNLLKFLKEKEIECFIGLIENLIKNCYFEEVNENLEYICPPKRDSITSKTFNGKIFEFYRLLLGYNNNFKLNLNNVIEFCLQKKNSNGCFLCTRILLNCLENNIMVWDINKNTLKLFKYGINNNIILKWASLVMSVYYIKNSNFGGLFDFYNTIVKTKFKDLSDLIIYNIFVVSKNISRYNYFNNLINFIGKSKIINQKSKINILALIALFNPNGWGYFNKTILDQILIPVQYTSFFKFKTLLKSNPPKVMIQQKSPPYNINIRMNYNLERYYSNILLNF